MTRRRPLTVEQADAEIEKLSWMRGAGTPNREVRRLFDCYAAVRAALHRQQEGEAKRPGFVERVEQRRG